MCQECDAQWLLTPPKLRIIHERACGVLVLTVETDLEVDDGCGRLRAVSIGPRVILSV